MLTVSAPHSGEGENQAIEVKSEGSAQKEKGRLRI